MGTRLLLHANTLFRFPNNVIVTEMVRRQDTPVIH